MDLSGRRIHIAGSVSPDTDPNKLTEVHALVEELTITLADEGANFTVSFGKEPFLRDKDHGPSIIFDWTVAETVLRMLDEGRTKASGPNGHLIVTLATSKTDSQIPSRRRAIYDRLRKQNCVSMEFIEQGWSAGAFRRQRLAQLGDILIVISGGEGVEHLAVEYSSRGKPVIPLDIDLGSSQQDGSGGGARLFRQALTRPNNFFRIQDGYSAPDLLDRMRTSGNEVFDPAKVASTVTELLRALTPLRVFYVRLLNDDVPEYASVEAFFRKTVDPLVKELGYEPCQMGIGKNEFAWMNQAIFDTLHHCSVVLVDLTAVRPNCFMELGYALGNERRVIVTARADTRIPFDSFALEAFLWKDSDKPAQRLKRMRDHWERNINIPPLVRPKEAR